MDSNSVYAAPKSNLSTGKEGELYRKGRYTIASPDVEWPSRCFKCNEKATDTKTTKLTYLNPWYYLSIFATIVLTVVLALIFRKKFTINMPLCEKHLKRCKTFLIVQWSFAMVALVGVIAGAVFQADLLIAIGVFAFAIVFILTLFSRIAFISKFKNGNLWIKGGGKHFLKSLPEYAV